MRVLVFATERTSGGSLRSPFVAIPDSAIASLPKHPQGQHWMYFATMAADDVMLSRANERLATVLQATGHFIWESPRLKSVARRQVSQPA